MSELKIVQPNLALDPVCGMKVDPAKARGQAEHGGQKFYFCSPSCAQKFQMNPEQYLNRPMNSAKAHQAAAEPAPTAQRSEYTCPMHPEVLSDKPGSCPICG